MNNLFLERSEMTVGMYRACVNLEGDFFIGFGYSWLEAINDLLKKISWKFHGK